MEILVPRAARLGALGEAGTAGARGNLACSNRVYKVRYAVLQAINITAENSHSRKNQTRAARRASPPQPARRPRAT